MQSLICFCRALSKILFIGLPYRLRMIGNRSSMVSRHAYSECKMQVSPTADPVPIAADAFLEAALSAFFGRVSHDV